MKRLDSLKVSCRYSHEKGLLGFFDRVLFMKLYFGGVHRL